MHWLDPDYLPEVSGTFERFLLNPRGEADGMILADGTEVHFPPHMSAEVCAAIRPGEKTKVTIRGVRPRVGDLIAAVAIATADGRRIFDNGPPKGHDEEKAHKHQAKPKREPMDVDGIVRRILHGPKGEARGALLEDGRIVRFAAKDAEAVASLLAPGRPLAVRGEGLTSALGTVIEAHEMGSSLDGLRPLKARKPKPARHGDDDAGDAEPRVA
ncbi:MAG: hypothetical protein HYR63_21160 [Proteobacteria bacterium]|nr:hypothetical protein [Pseudomonadota bacterium]